MPDRPVIQVRRATRLDVPAIVGILHAAFVEFETVFTPEAVAATRLIVDQFEDRFDDGPVWVVTDSDRLVGTVSARPDEDSLYVRSMAVLPTCQGHGAGRLLLETVDSYAIENGFRRLYLSTTPYFVKAVRLYEGFGFQETGDRKDLHGEPLVMMEKVFE